MLVFPHTQCRHVICPSCNGTGGYWSASWTWSNCGCGLITCGCNRQNFFPNRNHWVRCWQCHGSGSIVDWSFRPVPPPAPKPKPSPGWFGDAIGDATRARS